VHPDNFGGHVVNPNTDGIRKTLITVFLTFVLILSTALAATPWLHVDANKIKDPDGNVVILRGVSLIDLGFLYEWHGGAYAMIDRLTDKTDSQGSSPGFYPKVIRIPIAPPDTNPSWPHRFDPNDDTFYNDYLRPIVDYCKWKDLYVIIDWHYIDNTWDKVQQTTEFWQYMAPRFAADSHVIFELFNEPINPGASDTDRWLATRDDMQTWTNIVRASAPVNIILVAGPSWSQIIGPAATYPVSGTNIAYVSHIYLGHWLSGNTWYTDSITACAAVHPVIMTEWGFSMSMGEDWLLNGTITNYGQPLTEFLELHGISSTAWVASYNWGPPMFWDDWTLRCGDGEMGCFTKDYLYEKRNDDQPYPAANNMIDFAAFAAQWKRTDCSGPDYFCDGADTTCDGQVNLEDLGIFLRDWLEPSD
jgi:hypothetical protein